MCYELNSMYFFFTSFRCIWVQTFDRWICPTGKQINQHSKLQANQILRVLISFGQCSFWLILDACFFFISYLTNVYWTSGWTAPLFFMTFWPFSHLPSFFFFDEFKISNFWSFLILCCFVQITFDYMTKKRNNISHRLGNK